MAILPNFRTFLTLMFPGVPAPRKKAKRLLHHYGITEALRQAQAELDFAAAYGVPGEEIYWEEVIYILLKGQK